MDGHVQNERSSEVQGHLLASLTTHEEKVGDIESFEEAKFGENMNESSPRRDFITKSPSPFIYSISQKPPLIWTFIFACQQALLGIANPLTHTLIVCEMACAQEDDALKVRILSATMFMIGIASFAMCTFGARLPIFQGPSYTYIIPILALKSLDEWKCPRTFKAFDPTANATVLMADMGNGTSVPNRDVALSRIAVMSGSLVAAGVLHFLIGISGIVGILTRHIGPVTIVPTVMLIALKFSSIYGSFSQSDWTTSAVVTAFCITLSLYLADRKTPIPKWSPQKGFYIDWQPVHQLLSILLTLIFGCILSAILTAANVYSDDPNSKDYRARIDSRSSIIRETSWFIIPYPGQFAPLSFNAGIFLSFVVSTLSSVLESIGDYVTCARIVQVPMPPSYVFNRGLFVEGLMSTLSGFVGSCDATVSYGSNMAAMRITKVTSLRVLQGTGLIYMVLAIFGKIGAIFVTIPHPVLGGVMLLTVGMFLGVLLSYLEMIDLNSNRNVVIIGMALILGLAIPNWVTQNPKDVNTGSEDFDKIIRMLLSNPAFVSGTFSAFLDNTIPGTMKERGLLDFSAQETPGISRDTHIYRLPFLPDWFRRSRFIKYATIFDVSDAGRK